MIFKNSNVGIIFGNWKIHEGVLNTTRASLRSVGEYPFNEKFLASLTPFVGYGISPNSATPNFVKLNIKRNKIGGLKDVI